VELVGVLAYRSLGCEVVEFVSGPQSRVEEGSKIEWSVAGENVGFLGEGDSAEVGAAMGTQFDCYRTGCPWIIFIDSCGWHL